MDKILIIEDDISYGLALKLNFEAMKYQVTLAQNGSEALKIFTKASEAFAVVIADFHLPDVKGDSLLTTILKINPDTNLIVSSGDHSSSTLSLSLGAGAIYFSEKSDPMQITKLNKAVANFVRKFNQTQKLALQSPSLDQFESQISAMGMRGRSPELAAIAEEIENFSKSQANILISGETGTGKEVVAQALHNQSERGKQPFVAVNCGAIAKELIESELFGHVRGAFSGAIRDRQGRLHQAQGGTLFLDEIGDMPLAIQVKLLRVLQERQYEPLGSNKTRKFDVRIISATHVNLEKAVSEGRFREDLFYRLNVLRISIPPLRHRPDDIEALAVYFAEKIGTREHHQVRFLAQTMRYLRNYRWPGNVRELYNLVERLVTTSSGGYNKIEPKHLPENFFGNPVSETEAEIDFATMTYDQFKAFQLAQEKRFYDTHLARAKSIRDAAKTYLQMSHSTLIGRLDKLAKING